MTQPSLDGPLQEGDSDLFEQDVAYGLFKDKMQADRDALVRIARHYMLIAAVSVVLNVFLIVVLSRSSNAWKSFRFPFVWANSQGTPFLVTNAQSAEAYNDIPDNVVNGQIRTFLDMRYGASSYHARQLWGLFKTYWLDPARAKTFEEEALTTMRALQAEGLWRRVQVRVIQIDKRTPLEGGGTRYDATVEFVTSDLKAEDTSPKRTYWWRLRMAFSLGTPFGLTDPNEIKAAGAANQLNFRLLEIFKPVPIEIPGEESLRATQGVPDLVPPPRPTPTPVVPGANAPAPN